MGVYFNGRYYIKPQVATFVDDTALTPVGLVGSNVIGMMGPAKDGIPNQAYLLTSLNDATDIFGEGPLVDGVAMAFNGGAQYIWATRVGGTYTGSDHSFASVPAQATYLDTDIPFKLFSGAYGLHANGIQVITQQAGITGFPSRGLDISVVAQGNTITGTGIYTDVLKIANNSADPITFTITTGVLTMTGSGGSAIDLIGVATTTDLVERIKAVMPDKTPAINPADFEFTVMSDIPAIQIDDQVLVISNGSSGIMTADVKAAFDWLNAATQPYVYAEDTNDIFTTAVAKDRTLLANAADHDVTYTFSLAGGVTGDIDSTSFTGVLAEIYENLDLDLVVPIIDDYLGIVITDQADTINNAVLTHCKSMSTIGSEERVGLVGHQFDGIGNTTSTSDGDADDLTTDLINTATGINSPYMVLCAPRLKTFDIKGNLKFFNGSYTAAYIAGLIALFPVGEPITNKDITGVQALSTYFKNRQILQLIDNGVLVIERQGSALKVVQGVTTWVSNDNYNKKEISVRLATNYIAKNCRDNLKQFIGRKNSPQILSIIKGSLVQVLRELENNEIIVGTLAYPAYRNLTLTANGDTVRVTFECSPVLPINYILINIHATVFQATI
jgi:hypothetical protein